MSWWSAIFTSRAQVWVYGQLQAAQVPDQTPSQPVTPNESYLTVRLASMRVVNVRRGLSKFYGTVHSLMSMPHRSGTPAEFSTLTTPSSLQAVEAKHLDRVITVGKRLLGPVPYRGGDLTMEVGLFSIKEEELAGPFLSVLESLADVGGVTFIKAALPFTKPLTKGIELLTGSADSSVLEIGISTTLPTPCTGYLVVMRAPRSKVSVQSLKLTDNDFRLVDAASGKLVEDYPYMVLEISASKDRDAWFEIPELAETYKQLQSAAKEGKTNDVKDALTVFRRSAILCDDLLEDDGRRIAELVENQIRAAFPTEGTSMGAMHSLPDLKDYKLYE